MSEMLKTDYPYMYARISAKRAKLLEKEDYDRLVKMGPSEIARNLEEGEYKEDIDELGSDHDGMELVELALMRNISRMMGELIEISPDSLEPLINSFLRRYDILSIKRLLRWKKGGERGNIEDLLVPVGYYSVEGLMDLSEKSVEEICSSIEFPGSEVDYQKEIEDYSEVKKVERDLDRAYFKEMSMMAEGTESIWFSRFVRKEMEYENLKIALRLKKDGMKQEIREWLVSPEVSTCVEKVIESESLEAAVEAVEECEDISFEKPGNLEEVEHRLEVERLRTALRSLHTEPLGVTSIFGFIVAKMIEVKNLRMLIRAKETEIQNLDTIRSNLVTA
ncbi:MAG: V-type ATPase subunit [Candidatus Nanohaloarchaea archaeon]